MEQSSLFTDSTIFGSKWLDPAYLFERGSVLVKDTYYFLTNPNTHVVSIYHNILFFLSLFFLTLMAYCAIRLIEIRIKEHKHLKHEIEEYAHHQAEKAKQKEKEGAVSKNERWIKTLNYLFSEHPNDWKLAVIEADTMLEALLSDLGFKGESLGDKLKSATQEKFRDLTLAWEVHNIRNRIAHEGASFELSHREAKRVIAIYEQIFHNFGFI